MKQDNAESRISIEDIDGIGAVHRALVAFHDFLQTSQDNCERWGMAALLQLHIGKLDEICGRLNRQEG